ncbi:MAG: hotdog fold thioesterase, partial [Candidatus Bipolaricaulia bacterium]
MRQDEGLIKIWLAHRKQMRVVGEEELRRIRERIDHDPFARSLGIELLELGPGYGRAAMTVREEMLNFQGIPHGGAIFSLADAAFAAASNSHGRTAV